MTAEHIDMYDDDHCCECAVCGGHRAANSSPPVCKNENCLGEWNISTGPKAICPCGKPATWAYMPGEEVACDACVPRGCSCNEEPVDGDPENSDPANWVEPVDEQGRKYPCTEWAEL